MFKNIVYLSFLIIFFLFVSFFLIIVLSQNPCENCPSTSCSIACNTSLIDSTSTWKYYNFTILPIYQRVDVKIEIKKAPAGNPFQWYKLYANKTKEECPTTQSYDKYYSSGAGGNAWIYLPDTQEGTYHFLIECVQNCGSYELNLTCAKFCGNNIWEYFEECDQTARECSEPYKRCVMCECFDFRWTEAVGCKYYDYCEDGMNPDDHSAPCCVNETNQPIECCYNQSQPTQRLLNCSLSDAVRNPAYNASVDFCYNIGYVSEVTDKCIDNYVNANGVIPYC